jgi:hypothetical protein
MARVSSVGSVQENGMVANAMSRIDPNAGEVKGEETSRVRRLPRLVYTFGAQSL